MGSTLIELLLNKGKKVKAISTIGIREIVPKDSLLMLSIIKYLDARYTIKKDSSKRFEIFIDQFRKVKFALSFISGYKNKVDA